MKETRRFKIKQKVFTKENLLKIGELFFNEYSLAQKDTNHTSIMFRISCPDGTSYETETIELFEGESILDYKKIDTFEITFFNYTLDAYMNFSIVRGEERYSNQLIVRGCDRNWVSGVFTRLKDVINGVAPQDNWIIRHKTLVFNVIAIGLGAIIFFILQKITSLPIEPSEKGKAIRLFFKNHFYFSYLLKWFARWMLGVYFAIDVAFWLFALWPSIEFDFGPEHLKQEKLKRKRIAMVFSVGILPIIINVIYDLVKYVRMIIGGG